MKTLITILLLLLLLARLEGGAQQPDTTKPIKQVYYADIQQSIGLLNQLYFRIHKLDIGAKQRDTLDMILQNALNPILRRVPEPDKKKEQTKNK